MIPVPEYQYTGDDAKFNESKLVQQLYMNSIDESGRRYDVTRHVKRTSKYFSPKEEFLESAAELEDIIQGDEADSSDILLEGNRQPERLHYYLSTCKLEGIAITIIIIFLKNKYFLLKRFWWAKNEPE
jgi:hypothetical protein